VKMLNDSLPMISEGIPAQIEGLLTLCRPKSSVVVLGPTTPLSAVLFDYGVDVACGTRVVDPVLALRCLSQRATFRQVRGVRLLTLERQCMRG
jgi:uncharacterized protein (DUF4213/DUF364 family)